MLLSVWDNPFKNENVKIEPELFNMNVINGDLILESSVEYCRMITDKLLAELI